MNKAEKALVKKVKANFNSSKPEAGFTSDENFILERWRTLKIINEKAFVDVPATQNNHRAFFQVTGYPFTDTGEQEIKKSGYMHFRESVGITLLRDALTVIAFILSSWLAIVKIFIK